MTSAWRLVLVGLAALPLVLSSASAIAQQASEHFVAGVQQFQRGEYDQAIDDLSLAIQEQPDWEAAWYYLGAARFETVSQNLAGPKDRTARDYTQAKRALLRAIELGPSHPGPRAYMGRIYEEKADYDQAARFYHEELGLKRIVQRNAIRVSLGRVATKSGDYPTAISLLGQALDQEPLYVEAQYYMGIAQMALGDHKDAIKTLTKGIASLTEWRDKIYHLLRIEYLQTHPEDPNKASKIVENWDELRNEIWSLRAPSARSSREDLEDVCEEYARAQEFALDLHLWPEMNKALGDAYVGIGDWAAARNRYRYATKPREGEGSPNDADTWARIGRARFLEGKQAFERDGLLLRAIDEFKAAEGDANSPENGEGYARALYAAGLSADTDVEDMQPPLEADPVIARIFDGLGELYLYQANTYQTDGARGIKSHTREEAINAFDKALLFCPTCITPMLHKAQALVSLAEHAADQEYKHRTLKMARRILEDKALPLDPDNTDLLAELARAYLQLDELDLAADIATRALAIDRKHVAALNAAGLVKYYRNECVEAAAEFSRAIHAAPNDFQSYVNLGNALYGLRSWGRARSEYIRALDLIPKTTVANTSSQRPYILYLIARTQHEQRLYEKATETLGEALQLRTDFYEAHRLLGACYAGSQQWRAAEEAMRSALKSAPEDDMQKLASTHAHIGLIYEVQGRSYDAIAEYRIALDKNPANIEASDGLQRLEWRGKRAGQ